MPRAARGPGRPERATREAMMNAREATMTAPGAWRPRRRVLPRRSVRLRLTALYGALFLLSGAVLLAITGGVGASVSEVARANVRGVQGSTPAAAARGGATCMRPYRTRSWSGRPSRWAS